MSQFRRRVLIITLEPISKQMAGPAIRGVEIGKALAGNHDVTVFSPCPSEIQSPRELSDQPGFNVILGAPKSHLYKIAENSDIIFIQANVLKPYPALSGLGKYLVVDLYDPYLLAILAQYEDDLSTASSSYALMHQVLERHMVYADFAVCASEKQLDYWLGRLCALGRLTPEVYRFDPSFRKVIDVLPYGLPDTAPLRTDVGIKGRVDGIGEEDFLLLWGGGLWEWFDPITVISAVAQLSFKFPQLKLYFMGLKSPNPHVPIMHMAVKAKELASHLGVLNTHVFFSEDWTPYRERVNYLLDADIAVSAHFDLPETRFSFRTRILDYLWAGLPILTTRGDHLGEQIEREKAGVTLPYKDVEAWASAIEMLLTNKDILQQYRYGSSKMARQFEWSKVVKPLQEFCADPHHLPSYSRVKMPSLVERAMSVYSRGGKELVIKRSQEILKDMMRG